MSSSEITRQLAAAVAHHGAGQLREAADLYEAVLTVEPAHPIALHYLGVIALQHAQIDTAMTLLTRAVAVAPDDPDLLTNLGETCRLLGRLDEAANYLERVIAIDPGRGVALNILGVVQRDRGDLAAAEPWFARAVASAPELLQAWLNLANVHRELGRTGEAIAGLRRAAALRPQSALDWTLLGNAQQRCGLIGEAATSFEQALALQPGFGPAAQAMAFLRFARFDTPGAVASLRRAVAASPADFRVHSELMLALNYLPGMDAASILQEHRGWEQQHAAFLKPPRVEHANAPDPDRRLRVGYVSPDFRHHALGYNLAPLFQAHDRGAVEVFAYSNVLRGDDLTARFRAQADVWRDISGLPDDVVAAQVREDRIDILVDLTLHGAGHRLLVFARRPAPVQVTFAGYPGTTGLAAIDYRLTDPYLDPPGCFDDCYAEISWRLPETFWCYDPMVEEVPVNPLPAMANGNVTFGCLATYAKVNASTVDRWTRVLRAVPGSRLHLLAGPGERQPSVIDRFVAFGVAEDRITMVPQAARPDYFRHYHAIDISLDTLPYNGHTTSLDSYWMGVPVVTRIGETVVGRAGWSQLSNLGLTELAARNDGDFVRIAAALANDLPRLAELRRTLRARLQASPLSNAARFARGIESAYRSMWQHWCRTHR